MTIDEDLLREGLRPEQTVPAPIRPLGHIQRRAAGLRRRRRLAQAGGTAVLTAALALGVSQAGLPGLGGSDHAKPARSDPTVAVSRWTVADAVAVFYAPDPNLSGPQQGEPEFFDGGDRCEAGATSVVYHAERGVVRDSLSVRGPFPPDSPDGKPPNPNDQYASVELGKVTTAVDRNGRSITIAEWTYQGRHSASGHWRQDGRWWRADVNGLAGAAERAAVLTGLPRSGLFLQPTGLPPGLDSWLDPEPAADCRSKPRSLTMALSYGGGTTGSWWLEIHEKGSADRFLSHLVQPGSRVTTVHGQRAVWYVNDRPTPPGGGEAPSRNLLWRDADGHGFEIVADHTMTLERALRIAESVQRADREELGVPLADITNRKPVRTK